MNNSTDNINFDFAQKPIKNVQFRGCSIHNFMPSQTEKVTALKEYIFVIVTEGKGLLIYTEKRTPIIKGTGILIPEGTTAQFKADGIEPFTLISVRVAGEGLNEILHIIEKKENGILLHLGTNVEICDTARDLVNECSVSYSTDYSIMLALYEFLNSLDEFYNIKRLPPKSAYMAQAVEYIKKNYGNQITVEGIADVLGIERSYLSRLFKQYKNKSTQNYIIDYRIKEAKRMFKEEDMNVSQVCAAVGYTNIYCFSRIFKSRVGVPPKEYMERCREQN